jgi:hypothetical protein
MVALRHFRFFTPHTDLLSHLPYTETLDVILHQNKAGLWSATWQRPTSIQPVIPWNRFRISNWRGYTIHHIQTDLASRRLSPLLAPKRRTMLASFQIGWGGKGGGTWLACSATARLLRPRNLCLSGTLEEVCRTWWRLHWRLLSSHCIYFCNNSTLYNFSDFHFNDSCTKLTATSRQSPGKFEQSIALSGIEAALHINVLSHFEYSIPWIWVYQTPL